VGLLHIRKHSCLKCCKIFYKQEKDCTGVESLQLHAAPSVMISKTH
jgi:hypothetical protein